MHGPENEDELYLSYTSRPGPRLAESDDVDVDSPVLGLWADDEEKRMRKRRSGKCLLNAMNDGPSPVMAHPVICAQRSWPVTVTADGQSLYHPPFLPSVFPRRPLPPSPLHGPTVFPPSRLSFLVLYAC